MSGLVSSHVDFCLVFIIRHTSMELILHSDHKPDVFTRTRGWGGGSGFHSGKLLFPPSQPCLYHLMQELSLACEEGAEAGARHVSPGCTNPPAFNLPLRHLHQCWGKLCALRMLSHIVTGIQRMRCHSSLFSFVLPQGR